ncbi:MAG: hypothetical protein AVDCRST_MAG59-993 [uncultured Thermomicrobiales bacterium]|uniref:Disintegrin domain-containing protein n=1 Tax=uncultured Thermomicrobiales bacterium TaxID=1645740 RepID=A0A6J4U7Z9_9BACT|nr:MAG: hypothetical protein AVDCRST_MAG59-993 [uncultured Thermomicrobiales bacterium]
MDGNRFDRLSRTLATMSRRRAVGSLAAGSLLLLYPRRAAAACVEGTVNQFACGTQACINGQFEDFFEDPGTVCRPAAGECDVAEVCSGSSFGCPVDRKKTNGARCSSDGDACTDDICQNGACVHVSNTAACADDGNVCTADICANGICTHPALNDDTPCPAGACCNGECVDTGTDKANCGACGRACGAGRSCCKGACVKLASDKRNCGRCGRRCRGGERCRDGRCR